METEKYYNIVGELKKVQLVLQKLEYYGQLHPLIKTVKKKDVTTKEYEEYVIKERPYSWIPINIKYTAQVRLLENIVEYKIIGIPFAEVYIKYSLKQVLEREIQVIFNLEIGGRLIGKRILMKKMVAAQNQLMKSMNRKLENLEIEQEV